MTTHWQPKGILHPHCSATKFQLTRHAPAPAVAGFIERYWLIRWDLRGQPPYQTATLPQPYVNLVLEAGKSRIYGVASKTYTNLLVGQGQVFGIKFKPGAFYPLLKAPLATLTDRALPVQALFGDDSVALERAILALEDATAMTALADCFLQPRLPALEETVVLVNQIVDRIIIDRTMTKVEDLAAFFALPKRTLQRLFQHYVGVSPKWVIQRYRLHEAAEELASNQTANLPQLALDLGYFDQAHFSKAFKAVVGVSPLAYARQGNVNN